MAITRRQFMKRAGLATAGSFIGSGIFGNPWLRQVLAQTIGDRYFISFYLDGGNDGLNTVTPLSDGGGGALLRNWYQQARAVPPMNGTGGIRLSTTELAATQIGNDPTGANLAIHPAFGGSVNGGLHGLYQAGDVAVIQGVGYPEPNLSHDESHNKWSTADPLNTGVGTGWLGRHLAMEYSGAAIPAFCVNGDVPGEFVQNIASVLAVTRLSNFGFPYDNFDTSTTEKTARDTAFGALYSEAAAAAQPLLQYTGSVGGSTYNATQAYPQLSTDYIADRSSFSDMYDQGGPNNTGTSSSRDLREVAKVIYGVTQGAVDTRFFEVRNGGYDTHSDQGGGAVGGQQFNLHREVSDAIATFALDCQDMAVWDKVVIMVWTEFSRRVLQNDNGTDHGSQGPVFIIGGGINGGVFGKHPNIDPTAVNSDGNTVYTQGVAATPFRSTDIRDVYGTILQRWMNVPVGTVQTLLPLDPLGKDPNFYWRTANFNVGFLP